MKAIDLIFMSLSNLWRRKMRTSLTVLGVLIGTASIVVMMSMAVAQNQFMMQSIAGSRELVNIKVRAKGSNRHMGPGGSESSRRKSKEKKLDDKAIKELAALPHVKFAAPELSVNLLLMQGAYQNHLNVVGLSKEAIAANQFEFTDGGWPTELKPQQIPLIIGNRINEQFQNPNDRGGGGRYQEFGGFEEEGKKKKLPVNMYEKPVFAIYDMKAYNEAMHGEKKGPMPKKYMLKADGIIKSKSPFGYGPHSYAAYTEIEALKTMLQRVFRGRAWPGQPSTKTGRATGQLIYSTIQVESEDVKYTQEVVEAIKKLGFEAESQLQFVESMKKNAARTQLLLGGIGGISLLVAAIGIANTMMMSIYERTREIGIFKVLGCSLHNIRNIFLLEAAFIGLIGGIVGLGLSYALSSVINTASSGGGMMGEGMKMSVIPAWLAGGAVLFGSVIGMVSGLMPALRAMRLSALEAIRNQ